MSERIVLITGASGGLGKSVSDKFLNEGDTVIGVSRSKEDRDHPGWSSIATDLTKPDAAAAVIDEVLEQFGRIDVLVHALGGFAGGTKTEETDVETWARMMDMNANAAFYVLRAVLPGMVSRQKGRIIAVGSRAGVQPAPGVSAYGASKAALNALMQTVASENRDRGITANVILPSVIDTEANRKGAPAEEIAKWVRPESIAQLIYWLASDHAADINGVLVPIYGRA